MRDVDRFTRVIGTGGIGTGLMYRLDNNRPLGRNESRMATRLDIRDFCKQHIIMHYVTQILRDLKEPVEVVPIGAVGDDAMGHDLLALMKQVGMRLDCVHALASAPTMAAICYSFPDGAGGNLTEKHSACEKVTPSTVRSAVRGMGHCRGRLMVLAAPEVPLSSRVSLLEAGRRQDAFNAASFIVDEIERVRKERLLNLVDLVSLNIDEAAAVGMTRPHGSPAAIVRKCMNEIRKIAPRIAVSITNGGEGAYAFYGGQSLFLPALKVRIASTAGAGDAFLSGLMLGIIRGLPFASDDAFCCADLARAIAAMSVTSPHTIHFGITQKTLSSFYRRYVKDERRNCRDGNFLLTRS